jgi:hypothetical protein
MKILLRLLFIVMTALSMVSCNDGYRSDCIETDPVCRETPPTKELCLAAFERWFYDKNSSSCRKVAYSGCSQKGFETKAECESCKCIVPETK